jgi:hypothetical protein
MTSYQAKYNNVGFVPNSNVNALFSVDTIKFISQKATDLLRDFRPEGIIIPLDTVERVLNAVYESYVPSTGDIFTRYTIVTNENDNHVDAIINQTLKIIVSQVKADLTNECKNSNLTAWTQVLGDFNSEGLRAHPPIKLSRKRPRQMLFNMRY